MSLKFPAVCIAVFAVVSIRAAIIGANPPAQPLTDERIAALPSAQQTAWKKYFDRSIRQRQADRDFFRNEMKEHGVKQSLKPQSGHAAHSMPLDNRAVWYRSEEARRIADNIVSFQTPAGGWSKNLNITSHARAPGELFGPENGSQHLSAGDFDAAPTWDYVGTIDNDATTTELRFLAKVISENGNENTVSYRASFLRGLDYLFAAQFPNGGWPQVWPLQGGYHDAITLNDDAMLNVLELLRDVSDGQNEFAFVPPEVRTRASASFKRGMDCLLALQVVVNGRRTVWCQQYDTLTMQPCSARNYEMPSLASGESANVMLFLMQLPEPGAEEISAVHAAAAWFEKTKLMNVAFKSTGSTGRDLISAPGNGPIWARYYQIGDDKPIFGDRDKSIHDTVDEISKERRNGYSWFGNGAKRALQHYVKWSRAYPAAK